MHHPALPFLLAAAFALTAGCDKSAPKTAGPSVPSGPQASGTPAPANTAKAATPGALTLPKAASNAELQAAAPELTIDAARAITVAGAAAGTLPAPAADFKPGPITSLADALSGARGDGRILNARIDASLTAEATWATVQSAAKAGFTEVRVAVEGGGAIAIHMPAAASPAAPLPRAGHIALFMTAAGVNAKVFIGASGEVFPVAGSAGGKPITNASRTCPAAPRPAKGNIVPALIRSLGEPVCMANEKKDYWVAVSPSLSTTVQELVQLTAAMATPKAGCSPRIALAAPATDADMKRCGGALPTANVAAFVTANARKAEDFSAAKAAANRPLIKEVDLSKRPNTLAPDLAKKVAAKAGAVNDQATVAVGRIATSDNDTSRDAVARAIARHLGDVKNCYAKHLIAKEAGKPFSGALVMGIGISKDGKSMKPGFSRKGEVPPDLKLCVAGKAQSWSFDAPPGGKRIQAMVPIILRPPGAPQK